MTTDFERCKELAQEIEDIDNVIKGLTKKMEHKKQLFKQYSQTLTVAQLKEIV